MSLLRASVADTTHQRYKKCLETYLEFCKRLDLCAYPLHQQNVILFVTELAEIPTSYGNIKTHVAAVKFFAETQGYTTDDHCIKVFHKLYRVIRGIRRYQGKRFQKTPREPITPQLLEAIQFNMTNSTRSYEEKVMLWAAMLTAFFGFLRVSEYTSAFVKTFDPASTLCCEDITFGSRSIGINIKSSKTDPFRQGTVVRIAANDSKLCPVRALNTYWSMHPSKKGPFFTFQDGRYLTRKALCTVLRDFLPESCSNISSHSFRIGAAICSSKRPSKMADSELGEVD